MVVEQFVVCSDLSVNFVHVFLYDCRHSIVVWVTCFTSLEECIRVLSWSSFTWMVRVQCMCTEFLDCILIYEIFQIFVIPCFDLLDFVWCTETIEEVNERNFTFQCCTMCNRCQVHNFLYAGFTEHCTSSLTTGVNIWMITKNIKSVWSYCTGRYVEYTRKLFTSNFI